MSRFLSAAALIGCMVMCTSIALGQGSSSGGGRTVVLNFKIIEVDSAGGMDLEGIRKDRARLGRLMEGGKARTVADIQVRTRSGESFTARIGRRIPIQTATLPSGAADRSSRDSMARTNPFLTTAGISQIAYEDVGLNVDGDSMLASNNQLDVKLKIEMTGLDRGTGTLTPTFIQRTFKDVVRIKEDETLILLGYSQHEPFWTAASSSAAGSAIASHGTFIISLTAGFE